MFAYRGWQRLSALDATAGPGRAARVFYNALVTGTRPASLRARRLRRRGDGAARVPRPGGGVSDAWIGAVDRPLEPLWRGLLVYRGLTLASAIAVALYRLGDYAHPGRRAWPCSA